MNTIRLSSKGQVIIPKSIRNSHRWSIGQEFLVEETDDGILLKPKTPFLKTTVKDVAGCLRYDGRPKSVEEMDNAIKSGIKEQWCDRS